MKKYPDGDGNLRGHGRWLTGGATVFHRERSRDLRERSGGDLRRHVQPVKSLPFITNLSPSIVNLQFTASRVRIRGWFSFRAGFRESILRTFINKDSTRNRSKYSMWTLFASQNHLNTTYNLQCKIGRSCRECVWKDPLCFYDLLYSWIVIKWERVEAANDHRLSSVTWKCSRTILHQSAEKSSRDTFHFGGSNSHHVI